MSGNFAKIDNYEVRGQAVNVQRFLGLKPEGIQHFIGSQSMGSEILGGLLPAVGAIQSVMKHLMSSIINGLGN